MRKMYHAAKPMSTVNLNTFIMVTENLDWSPEETAQQLCEQYGLSIYDLVAVQINEDEATLAPAIQENSYRQFAIPTLQIVALLTLLIGEAQHHGHQVHLVLGQLSPLNLSHCLMGAQVSFEQHDRIWHITDNGLKALPMLRLRSLHMLPSESTAENMPVVYSASEKMCLSFYLQLSGRKRQIVRDVCAYLTNRQIGEKLNFAASVVADRLTEIYAALSDFTGQDLSKHSKRTLLIRFFDDFFEHHPELD